MDMVAEYAHAYGGAPRPDQPWHEVLALASRVARFDVRGRLQIADGTLMGQPVDEGSRGVAMQQRAALRRAAYPLDEDA